MSRSFEDYLDRFGTLTYTNVGTSMMPLLRQGKDLFILKKRGPERLAVGDVVLYRRPPDKYVLHRIVEVRPEDYVILGDNCAAREYGIRDEDILAVMTGYVRDGVEHSVTEKAYRDYTARILRNEKPRVAWKRTVMRAKRIVKKIIGRK
ncbi:MAG: S24/S26 family peptidase [Clostridia bacterium]|nr:S24/S26 family peptidase [Clostridia bacterium]